MLVGLVAKPIGLKGDVKVKPVTDNPERFAPGGRVWVEDPGGGPLALDILAVGETRGGLRVSFAGVDTVEEAEGLRDVELFVSEDEVPPLPEGEYYYFQILGMEVYTHDGDLLGKVADIFPAGEKDVYVVKGGGKEYLIPVNDETVRTIDVANGRIDLFPIKDYLPE